MFLYRFDIILIPETMSGQNPQERFKIECINHVRMPPIEMQVMVVESITSIIPSKDPALVFWKIGLGSPQKNDQKSRLSSA